MTEFISRLGELQRGQNSETERLQVRHSHVPDMNGTGLTKSQTESRTRMDEYNVTARKLNSELEMLKQQKSTMKSQIVRTHVSSKAVW